jgi:CHAD domain-containing protein
MKDVFSEADRQQAMSGLRWIQQLTGPTRDLDVMLLDLPAWRAELPDVFAAELDHLTKLLVSRRRNAQRALVRSLHGRRFDETWQAWRRFLDDSPASPPTRASEPVAAVAGDRIWKVYRRAVVAGGAVTDDSPAEVLHDLRKQGKELRYLLEMFGPAWPANAVRPIVGQLKALQDVLGRFHDAQVQADWLRSLAREVAGSSTSTETALVIGAIVDRLASGSRTTRGAFGETFAAFASGDVRSAVRTTFARSGEGRPPA